MERPVLPTIEEAKLAPQLVDMGKEQSNFSSTSVREFYQKGELNEIKKIVPTLIYDDIITYLTPIIKP